MNLPNVKISVWPCKNKGKIVATAKVMIGNAISIYSLRLIQGRQRMFLGMPQMLDRAGDYRDVFFSINGEAREELTKMVIHTYNSAKNNFWDFPSQEEFKPEVTVRLFSDPAHNMIGYADILINKAFRIVNVRIFQGENGRRQIIFPERGYREDGEIIVKSIFEWATRREIRSYYTMVPYEPQKWRSEPETCPSNPGFFLGTFRHRLHGRHITAWIDAGDSHAMMIASPGGGKTAYFLYPNIEYAMACGVSFVTLDTKGDLYRNMATIGEKYYGYKTVVYDLRKPMHDFRDIIMGVNPHGLKSYIICFLYKNDV